MNRVDVVDLVVDLVDVGLDIDLVDVDLDVDLVDVGPVDVVPAVPSRVRVGVGVVFVLFAPQKKSRGRKGTLAAGCPLDKANGRGHKSTLGKRGLSPHRNPTVRHLGTICRTQSSVVWVLRFWYFGPQNTKAIWYFGPQNTKSVWYF